MVTRRVSEESLEAAKSSLTRRVTSSLLRFAGKVSVGASHGFVDLESKKPGLTPKRLKTGLKKAKLAVDNFASY